MTVSRRLGATALGLLASRVVPEIPDEIHPVARFGETMTELEEHLWRDERRAGVVYTAVGVGIAGVAGRGTHSTMLTVGACAAGEQLRSVAGSVADHLDAGDLQGARGALPALVGRDPSGLDESGIAAAAIESVAENTVDAVFGPAFWAVVAGASGAAIHRAANTMDAMVGRRSERYERFGWAAARLDDGLNYVPARLFAVTLAAIRPDRADAVRDAVRSDAPAHPSPNAGVAEAAMAAVLACQLGGPLRYGDVVEERPVLGTGPRPTTTELREAIAVARQAETMLTAALGAGAALLWRPRRRGGGRRRRRSRR